MHFQEETGNRLLFWVCRNRSLNSPCFIREIRPPGRISQTVDKVRVNTWAFVILLAPGEIYEISGDKNKKFKPIYKGTKDIYDHFSSHKKLPAACAAGSFLCAILGLKKLTPPYFLPFFTDLVGIKHRMSKMIKAINHKTRLKMLCDNSVRYQKVTILTVRSTVSIA